MFRKNKVNRIGKELQRGAKINGWGVNLIGLIYESENKLQILMHFSFIEQELLLSKNNKRFNKGLFYFFSSHIYIYIYIYIFFFFFFFFEVPSKTLLW